MAQNIKFHTVTFLPENKVLKVEDRKSIFETILKHNPHGIDLHFACGAEGICRKCKVRAFQQMGQVTPTERGCLTEEELSKGIRLACQARVIQDTTVEILYKMPFTIALMDEPIAGMAAAGMAQGSYAVAVDLGVNTLMLSLVDLFRGRKIAVVTDTNPQIELGVNFEQRVAMVEESEINLEVLNEELLLRIDILIEELCRAAGVEPEQVCEIVVSGATGMLHLMLKGVWNPLEQSLGPKDGSYHARQFDIKSSHRARVYALPVISAYAGADMTAAILATRLHKSSATTLLLDLGTNARAVLYHQGVVSAAGAAECAAFDCVGIACGMRPETGAIEHVAPDGHAFRFSIIGESLPRGICGSGLLELAAALKQAGLIDDHGVFQRQQNLQHPSLGFIDIDAGSAFRLYTDDGVFSTDIFVTQEDIYMLRSAKARVTDLIQRLLDHAGIVCKDVDRVLVSGAFGALSDPSSLFDLGMLPPVLKSRVSCVGNASKQGAQMVLLDKSILAEAEALVQHVVCLPAAVDPIPEKALHFLPAL
ncbi:MAG: DUF4445 domain-containing protein [Deltaproteobacteria bacterium]|nr:DUF4445 domain-containing protein [Deltaproteobacteria bacterium]